MDKLFTLAYEEGIEVQFFDFKNPIKGIYFVEEEMPPVIGLDNSLKYNKPLLRSILGEELGHHFTSVGSCIPCEFYNYSDRLKVSKIEYKALRWAALYFISDNELLDALRDGIDTQSHLAEHFMVTPDIISLRLKLFEKNLCT